MPLASVTPTVRPRVTSAGWRWENETATVGTGRPAESVTRNDITPVSWIPDPCRPSTSGAAPVLITAAGGPAGPVTTGPASGVGGGGVPASVVGDEGPTRVTRVPLATLVQMAVTRTEPAPQWLTSKVKSQA